MARRSCGSLCEFKLIVYGDGYCEQKVYIIQCIFRSNSDKQIYTYSVYLDPIVINKTTSLQRFTGRI